MEGWVEVGDLLPRWFTRAQTVTRVSINFVDEANATNHYTTRHPYTLHNELLGRLQLVTGHIHIVCLTTDRTFPLCHRKTHMDKSSADHARRQSAVIEVNTREMST